MNLPEKLFKKDWFLMATDKEKELKEEIKELKEEIKELKELLEETMMAMCDFRTMKGYCSKCNTEMFCRSKKIIPKVEKVLSKNKSINKDILNKIDKEKINFSISNENNLEKDNNEKEELNFEGGF